VVGDDDALAEASAGAQFGLVARERMLQPARLVRPEAAD
jgi:hypothetical protein